MSLLVTLSVLPCLLLFSLPLVPFAFFTTVAAFSLLSLRAAVLYAELFIALVRQHLSAEDSVRQPRNSHSLRSRRVHSFPSIWSLTPGRGSIFSHGIPGPPVLSRRSTSERDFEGIGGWRETSEDVEGEATWTSLNSRLELPAVGLRTSGDKGRKHQRSRTSGSIRQERSLSRQTVNRRSLPDSTVGSGTLSPEDGISMSKRPNSMVEMSRGLGDRVITTNTGRIRGSERRKSGSSESTNSGTSQRTMASTTSAS